MDIQQQIGTLNFRLSDMVTQLNAVVKALMDENVTLREENAALKGQGAKVESAAK